MTPSVRTIHRDAVVSRVASILSTERIVGAPLVDNGGDMVGIIMEADLDHLDLIGGNPNITRAWEVACSDVVTIPVSASLQEAARTILDTRVRNLIVTDGMTPVGVLSVSDLMRYAERQNRGVLLC
ncbi:MAG: CBS domain-containing protein [Thiogranum sp.]